MLGSRTLPIDAKDFVRGMSTSADVQDGGFSPETTAIGLATQPGVLNGIASATDASTNVAGNIIASCEDYQTVGPNPRYFLDASGNYYTFNGSTMSLTVTDNTGVYTDGKSDLVPFNSNFYATTTTDVTQWNGGSLNKTYWTVAKGRTALNSSVPHPMQVFQKQLWIGDGNLLHQISESGTATYAFLTLSANDTITAMAIEPGSAYLLIAVTTGQNISDTLAKTNKVHYYDGYSNKPVKTVIVEDLVTAFYVMGGAVFAFYGQNFGQFTGSGMRFLRALNVALSNAPSGQTGGLIWKNRVTSIGSNLYYADGKQVVCFGNVRQRGGNVFWNALSTDVLSNNAVSCLCNVGSNKLGIATATNKFYYQDQSATGNVFTFLTNKYDFPRPVYVRQIWFLYKNQVASGATPYSLTLYDESGAVASFGSGGLITLTNDLTVSSALKKVQNVNTKHNTLQLRILQYGASPGLRRIIVRYDYAEL